MHHKNLCIDTKNSSIVDDIWFVSASGPADGIPFLRVSQHASDSPATCKPASRAPEQQAPVMSTAAPVPWQTPHASRCPAQQAPSRSSVTGCPRGAAQQAPASLTTPAAGWKGIRNLADGTSGNGDAELLTRQRLGCDRRLQAACTRAAVSLRCAHLQC